MWLMVAAPRHRSQTWRDIGTSGGLIALWIVPWLILTTATWIAGGHPSASPVAFINPGDMVRRISSGRGPFEWWVLVAPTSTVIAWRFWAGIAIMVAAITVGGVGANGHIAQDVTRQVQKIPACRPQGRPDGTLGSRDGPPIAPRAPRSCRRISARPARSAAAGNSARDQRPCHRPDPVRKTAGLVIPNLFEWDDPSIATSTKSELVDLTAGHRQSMGPVHVYDPTGEMAAASALDVVTDHWMRRLDHAWTVASWLSASFQQGVDAAQRWSHWAESGNS